MNNANINEPFLHAPVFFGSSWVLVDDPEASEIPEASSVMSSVSEALDKTGASGLARFGALEKKLLWTT